MCVAAHKGFGTCTQVYLKEEDRPPVGEGLNCAAEVTLMNVRVACQSASYMPAGCEYVMREWVWDGPTLAEP